MVDIAPLSLLTERVGAAGGGRDGGGGGAGWVGAGSVRTLAASVVRASDDDRISTPLGATSVFAGCGAGFVGRGGGASTVGIGGCGGGWGAASDGACGGLLGADPRRESEWTVRSG